MRAVSDKRRVQNVEFAKVREFVMERDGGCMLRQRLLATEPPLILYHRCSGALDPHHIVPVARDVTLRLDPDNLVVLCRAGHDWVHTHPVPATLLGLLKSAPVPALPKEETT